MQFPVVRQTVMSANADLQTVRRAIDGIDEALADLLACRICLSHHAQKIKGKAGLPVRDAAREGERRLGAGLSYCLRDASPLRETPAELAREPVRALPMAADQGEDPGSGSDRRLRAGGEDSLKNPWTISPSHPSETQVRAL
jgi:hypothetical protein